MFIKFINVYVVNWRGIGLPLRRTVVAIYTVILRWAAVFNAGVISYQCNFFMRIYRRHLWHFGINFWTADVRNFIAYNV